MRAIASNWERAKESAQRAREKEIANKLLDDLNRLFEKPESLRR
jgi:hypothetical protein